MLQYHRFANTDIEPSAAEERPDWIDLSDPQPEEIHRLTEKYSLPHTFLTSPLDPKERPRIDQENGATLFIVRLPLKGAHGARNRFTTVPAGLILAEGLIFTVCREAGLIQALMDQSLKKKRPWSAPRLAFAVFLASATRFIQSLEEMEDMTDQAESRLKKAMQNDEILILMNVEKDLVNLSFALKSNHTLLDKVRQLESLYLPLSQDERDLLDDALIENQQAVFMADIFSQILGSIGDAFSSIISNNLNKIMKFLAGVTIVLMLPAIIAGFYGMNVSLPMAEVPGAFWLLIGLALALMLVVGVLFIRKKWM